jgi:serine phosphatase RsbU (regulator of sigma subunit)
MRMAGTEANGERLAEKIEKNWQIQQAINSILRVSLEPVSLTDQLHRVLHLVVGLPWLALERRGCIFLADEEARELVMGAQIGMPAGARSRCGRVPFGTCLCGRAIADNQVVFAGSIDERHTTHYEGMQPHGHYCVPIACGPRRIGVLSLYVHERHPQSLAEEKFLRAVADILAGMIDRRQAESALRKQEEERRVARDIQQGLLPKTVPTLPGFRLAGRSVAAHEVGGDCFDFIPMRVGKENSLGVLVADASGHGIGAALLVAETRAYLRALALACTEVGTLLDLSNQRLASDLVTDHFVTLFLLRLDPRTRSLHYSNAGHWPGYVLTGQGTVKAVLASTGVPLGIESGNTFPAGPTIALESGEVVFLFTDGIIEAISPEGTLFGLERALRVVQAHQQEPPDDILEALFCAVIDFSGQQMQDDITAVIVKADDFR